MAKRNVDITKEGDDYVFKHRSSGKEIVRTPSEQRRDAYALSIRRKSRNTIDVHHQYRRSFEEYYYGKNKKLTEDDKDKKKDKIRDDGGRPLGPLDEDREDHERVEYLKSRTNELARQYTKKGLKPNDAINAAYSQAEREWDARGDHAIDVVKKQYRRKSR